MHLLGPVPGQRKAEGLSAFLNSAMRPVATRDARPGHDDCASLRRLEWLAGSRPAEQRRAARRGTGRLWCLLRRATRRHDLDEVRPDDLRLQTCDRRRRAEYPPAVELAQPAGEVSAGLRRCSHREERRRHRRDRLPCQRDRRAVEVVERRQDRDRRRPRLELPPGQEQREVALIERERDLGARRAREQPVEDVWQLVAQAEPARQRRLASTSSRSSVTRSAAASQRRSSSASWSAV